MKSGTGFLFCWEFCFKKTCRKVSKSWSLESLYKSVNYFIDWI